MMARSLGRQPWYVERMPWSSEMQTMQLEGTEESTTTRSVYERLRRRPWLYSVSALTASLICMLALRSLFTLHDRHAPPSVTTDHQHEQPHVAPNDQYEQPHVAPNDQYERPHVAPDDSLGNSYNVLQSSMTHDGKYFSMDFGDYNGYNGNLIPLPQKQNTWIMVAQLGQEAEDSRLVRRKHVYSKELMCEATYRDGKMRCNRSSLSLPIASTTSKYCTGDLYWVEYLIGPSDARVYLGPEQPYIQYGSASQYTCYGLWLHDLRRLTDWDSSLAVNATENFFYPTELRRPQPWAGMEKNWFAFWDAKGDMYLHYDVAPHRTFAKMNEDATNVGEDLSAASTSHDKECLEKYLPKLKPEEHIHQATNSLAITMCNRHDAECDPDQNTYIMEIFHHKMFNGHNLYEPYVWLFKNSAPFEMHAIASKPFWIYGRGEAGEQWSDDPNMPASESQMMYTTSMSWKGRDMKYQGYLDDEIIISFGIEDKSSGGIDVFARDLVKSLNYC